MLLPLLEPPLKLEVLFPELRQKRHMTIIIFLYFRRCIGLGFHEILTDFLKIKKSHINKSCGIQSRQSRIFNSRQRNPMEFKWDFPWLIKCLLVFKRMQILIDSFVEWILQDFLVKNIHNMLIQQSHKKPWRMLHFIRNILFVIFLYCFFCFFLFCWRMLLLVVVHVPVK